MATPIRHDAVALTDRFLDKYTELFRMSGSVLISRGDETLYERHMGMENIEKGIPLDRDTMYTFYSISKAFAAIGLMRLCDRGLVDVDMPVAKYVPEAAGFGEGVTLRHCLCHVSGLPDFTAFPELSLVSGRVDGPVLRAHIREMAKSPLKFTPGTVGDYANINFALTALAIENVTGMEYSEYMEKVLFPEMGADSALIDHIGRDVARRCQGYEVDGNGYMPIDACFNFMFGAGDVIGRVQDVAALARTVRDRGVLSSRMWDEVLKRDPVSSYGMGCGVFEWHGKTRINHSGGHLGFRTLHFYLPEEDFDVIYMSNCGYGNSRNAVAEAIHAAFFGGSAAGETFRMDAGYIPDILKTPEGDVLSPKMPPVVPLSPETDSLVVGRYDGLTVERDGDGYKFLFDSGRVIYCYPIEGGIFYNRYADDCYGYGLSDDGAPVFFGKRKLS